MPPSIYDTHASVKRLTEAGMSEPQAGAIVTELVQLMANTLATKDDLQTTKDVITRLESTMEHRFELMHAEMRLENERQLKRLTGVMATLMAVFAAAIKFL